MSTTEQAPADIERDPMWYRRYIEVQAVLDEALGTKEEDGAGEGIAGDVALLADQRDTARRRAAGYAAELEEAIRERTTAEAKLAEITTHCRQRLDMAIVQGPVSRLCQEIRAIISDEENR